MADPRALTAVRCGRLVDVVAGEVLSDRVVFIRGERVESVVPDDGTLPEGPTVLDLRDHTVTPGLIDCHAHLVGEIDSGHSYAIPTTREGGIWAPGGGVVHDGRLYYAVGNGESTSGFDGSDTVIALDPDLRRTDFFAPSTWAEDNEQDLEDLNEEVRSKLDVHPVDTLGEALAVTLRDTAFEGGRLLFATNGSERAEGQIPH